MEIQEIIKYIDEPIKMKEEALQDMKALLEKYPFFHTANLLFVKAAHNLQDDLYNSEINKVSASIPNREILHELINLKEIQIVVDEKEAKPKESKTRTDIRKKITKRRQKRTTNKTLELLESGKARHLSLIKDFFEPVLEKLLKNVENFRVIIKNDVLPVKNKEAVAELSIEDERARKKVEREKRMSEKRRLRDEKVSGGEKEKRKADREKRKAEREMRMTDRLAGKIVESPEEEKNEAKPKEVPVDDREKRKLERQKRKEEKEKEIAKQISEKTKEISEDKKEEDVVVAIEGVVLADREKRRQERKKRKEEKEKEIAKQIAEKTKDTKVEEVSFDKKEDETEGIVVTIEETVVDDREKRKLERLKRREEKEIAKQISEKTKDVIPDKKNDISDEIQIISEISEGKKDERKAIEKLEIDDPFTKITSIPSSTSEKEKGQVEDVKDVLKDKKKEEKNDIVIEKEEKVFEENKTKIEKETNKIELKQEFVDSNNEIEDIYSKILSSKRKRPLSKERKSKTDIIVKDNIETKSEVVEEKKDVQQIIVKDETKTKTEEIGLNKDNKADEIEFIVKDNKNSETKTEEIKLETETKDEEVIILDENEAIFELIETKGDEKDSKIIEKTENIGVSISEEKEVVVKIEAEKKEERVEKDKKETLEKEEKVEAKTKQKAASDVFDRIANYKNKKSTSTDKTENKEEPVIVEDKIELVDIKKEEVVIEDEIAEKVIKKTSVKQEKKEAESDKKAAGSVFDRIANYKNKKSTSTDKTEKKEEPVIVEDKTELVDIKEEIIIKDEIAEKVIKKTSVKQEKKEAESDKKAAGSVFDRIANYKNKKSTSTDKTEKKEEPVIVEDKIELVDIKKEEVVIEDEIIEIVETEKTELIKEEEIELSDADNSLIDKFITGKPAMKRQVVDEPKENEDISKESVKVKKPIITELMASIFVNQGKYIQAIEIYEQLILKNPEKKDYFASKIKETEILK